MIDKLGYPFLKNVADYADTKLYGRGLYFVDEFTQYNLGPVINAIGFRQEESDITYIQ